MRLTMHDGREGSRPPSRATDDYADAGPQDVVILALKAHQVEAVVRRPASRCSHENTVVIPMQNGIPFWYFQRHGGELAGPHASRRVDPGGAS